MSTWEYQFNQFLQLLSSPLGILVLIGGAVLAAMAITKPWARLTVLAVLVWSTTLTRLVGNNYGNDMRSMLGPLQAMADNTRTITLVCLTMLLLPTLAAQQGRRLQLIAVPAMAFVFYQVVYSLLDAAFFDRVRGLLGLVIVGLAFVVLTRGVGSWMPDLKRANGVVKAMGAVGGLFVLASTLQGVIEPETVKHAGRFFGTTANPQFAATTIGITLPTAAYLVVQKDIGRLWRTAMCVTAGLLVVFLLWTGSRTGLLMSGVGLLLLFRLRLGKLSVAAAAAGVVLLGGLQLFGGEIAGADRLLSTEDTRTGAWMNMWNVFLSSPLTGASGEMFTFSENSYLWTAAKYGLLALLPMLLAVAAFGWFVLRLQLVRPLLDRPHRLLADLSVSIIVTALVGGFFEGYLLGQFNVVVFTLFVMTAAGQYVLDAAATGEALAGHDAAAGYALPPDAQDAGYGTGRPDRYESYDPLYV